MTGQSITGRRCWRYAHGCRLSGDHSVRIGSHVYHYCSNPEHQPRRQEKS